LALAGILFLGSCQEIEEIPIVLKDSLEVKFDRLMFLRAVNKATAVYVEEARNPKSSKNLRSITENEQNMERYIGDIANALESQNFSYNVVSGNTWDQPIIGNSNSEQYSFDYNDLPLNVSKHLKAFESNVDEILLRYENHQIDDSQLVNELKAVSNLEGHLSQTDASLSFEDREALAEIFYSTGEFAQPIRELLLVEVVHSNAFFKGRFGRAFLRVMLGVVATAIIVAVPVAAIAFAKLTLGASASTLKLGVAKGVFKGVASALTKGVTIGKYKISAALVTGLHAGLKNANKNWDKEWQGIRE
jgi:hypothetical protein